MKPSAIHSIEEFNRTKGIDRLYIHLMEPERFPLNPSEEEYLSQLTQVWMVVVDSKEPRLRLKAVMDGWVCTAHVAKRMLDDAAKLYGIMYDVQPILERKVMYHRLLALAQKAEDKNDFKGAHKFIELAHDILGKIESSEPRAPKKYAQIVPTTDPRALNPNAESVSDADYQEIPEE